MKKDHNLASDHDIDLRDLIANLPGYVYWKDKNYQYMGANNNLVRASNLNSSEDFIGKRDEDFGWGFEQAEAFRADDREVMRTNIVKITEHKLDVSDNRGGMTSIFVRTEKRPLHNAQGEVVGVVGVALDITELKQMEENLQKEKEAAEISNKAKTEFVENMRHDIRTPLSGIVGFSELLMRETDSEKIKKYTSQLADSSKELMRFLNEILESINVASGEIPILKKKFSLKVILENVIKLHQPKANEKGLNLDLHFGEDIPKYLIGDPVRIYRIILELLVNALKFTKTGDVRVYAKLAKKEERDVIIQLEVEDTGPGIPPEKQQELFVRFKRFTPSYHGIYKGVGLGLSIIRQFIDDLQGEVYVDKETTQGAKFVCLIPLKVSLLDDNIGEETPSLSDAYFSKVETESKNVQPLPKKSDRFSLNKKHRILIVEDQEIAANVVKEILTKLGCEVDIAPNGSSAISLAQTYPYELIFMDIGLPDIDGYQVTEYIRSQIKLIRVPIIGLTGHVDLDKKQRGLEVGMSLVLTKPLLQEVCIHVLRNFVLDYSQDSELLKSDDIAEADLLKITGQVVDFNHAKKALSNQVEIAEKLLLMLVNSFEEELMLLEHAVAIEDWKAVEIIAHKLRGGCDYCGALRLKEACNRMYNYLVKQKTKIREPLFQQMKREMESLKWYVAHHSTHKYG